jgi:enoyl-CoA hydratase/carnithine racemase
MGACSILPRIVGQGRASDLLYSGRSLGGVEAHDWGFLNRLVEPEDALATSIAWAQDIAAGPSFGHAMTKKMLHQEWAMGVDEAIEAEAQAQAICMMTEDFHRAYHAFVAKQRPSFEGN